MFFTIKKVIGVTIDDEQFEIITLAEAMDDLETSTVQQVLNLCRNLIGDTNETALDYIRLSTGEENSRIMVIKNEKYELYKAKRMEFLNKTGRKEFKEKAGAVNISAKTIHKGSRKKIKKG